MQLGVIHRQKAKKTMQNALVSTFMSGNVAGCARDASSQPVPSEVPFGEILAKENAPISRKAGLAAGEISHQNPKNGAPLNGESGSQSDVSYPSVGPQCAVASEDSVSAGQNADSRLETVASSVAVSEIRFENGVDEDSANLATKAVRTGEGHMPWAADEEASDPEGGESYVTPGMPDSPPLSGRAIGEDTDPVSESVSGAAASLTSDLGISESAKRDQSLEENWPDSTSPFLGQSVFDGQARDTTDVAVLGDSLASSIDTKERLQVPDEAGLRSEESLARPLSELSKKVDGAADPFVRFDPVSRGNGRPEGKTTDTSQPETGAFQPQKEGSSLVRNPTALAPGAAEPPLEARTLNAPSNAESGQSRAAIREEYNQERGLHFAPKSIGTGMNPSPTLPNDLGREQPQPDLTGEQPNLDEIDKGGSERRIENLGGTPETLPSGTARDVLLARAGFGNAASEMEAVRGPSGTSEIASKVPGVLRQMPFGVTNATVVQQPGQPDGKVIPELGVSLGQVAKVSDVRTSDLPKSGSAEALKGTRPSPAPDPSVQNPIQAYQAMEMSNGFMQNADDKALLGGFDGTPAEFGDIRSDISLERAQAQASGPTERGVGETQMRSNVRYVATTIAERAVANSTGTLELRMSPEELGALRITFSQGESSLAIVIQADRPETLDLFRRNIEQFSQDLKSLGYDDVSMSFEGGHEEEGGAGRDDGHVGSEFNQVAARPEAQPEQADSSDSVRNGLDLRL
ncbi:flagellar hook-length control protein FliK [Tropicimonas sp. TH_r6]|uniref:flagellar hook-length control protein FliK n=1 Tax=Tropicimonas sp. TH_r6 TaxID=3082085 RepID=UPI002953F20B|nr:flagellar hook-length control protein FliK [Tropicimonas sp. TH_r6]MDV7144776.1 flagellar hook-length control protein FliK [Tropicimonas sp. TH_r6]